MSGEPVTVILLGEPVPFARTRINKAGAHFTPDKQRNAGDALRWQAKYAMAGREPFDCPLRLYLLAEFAIPASWSKRRKRAALIGAIPHSSRPDVDNLCKLAIDAFNKIVFRDDALIFEAHLRKVYGRQPKLVATIEPIAGDAA